jgi:metallophosphoesterase (TIGR00282 family)
MSINILCVGDLVGKAGRSVLAETLPGLIKRHDIEFVVCNGENAAGGSGITPQIFEKLLKYGVDVVTLGDHCFRKSEILPLLNSTDRLVRPANLPTSSPGKGWTVTATKSGRHKVGVVSLLGQMNMGNSDSPWTTADEAIEKLSREASIRIVDFHAEATSEKIAMGWHCNGRASIVFGTHTHVPTADASVLNKGTAFISDLGMTGPYDSILGRRKDRVLKFLTASLPQRFEMATADTRMYAMLVAIEPDSGMAISAELLCLRGKNVDAPYDGDDRSPNKFPKKQTRRT